MLAGLARVPQGALSRGLGRLADVPLPRPLRAPVLGMFARALGIDVAEAELPVTAYRSVGQFFVRRLRPGARRWPESEDVAGAPVDGIAGQFGTIRDGKIVQAKGRWYSAAELLGDATWAASFDGGTFVTIYLGPRHYHRIHSPTRGRIVAARYVPGALLPVNAPAVAHVPHLFARNERLICDLRGPLGRIAMVAVGAYNVGKISATFDDAWSEESAAGGATNRRGKPAETRRYAAPPDVRQGEEIMAFHLGSTVVILFERDRAVLRSGLRAGAEVRLGEPLARANDDG